MSLPERFGIGRTWRAAFIDRPNRFLVRCRSRALGTVEAFMPNPGRMWELLLPGVTLYLEHTPAEDRSKLRWRFSRWLEAMNTALS